MSYREVSVQNDFDLDFEAPTVSGVGAIHAWQAIDPDVELVDIDVSNDGRMTLAARATDLGGGQWHYEYAVHNNNSDRSAGSFEIPIPAGVTVSNVGFHDVDYHSGEPYDGTDWAVTVGADAVTWSTDDFGVNPDANALRWGTMYNFRFDADAGPAGATADIGLFRPGSPDSVQAITLGPSGLVGPNLNLSGVCPGSVTVTVDGLTAGGNVAIVSGTAPGVTTIPNGVCAGVELDVDGGSLLAVVTADGSGVFDVTRDINAGLCGLFIQAVDLSTCELSNVVQLP